VRLAGGRVLERRRECAVGAAGLDTRARHRELVRAKFLACGGAPEVANAVESLEAASPRDVAWLLTGALGTSALRNVA